MEKLNNKVQISPRSLGINEGATVRGKRSSELLLLSVHPSGRCMVGAVGIENNTDRNFKGLEQMLGSAKALKRNNEESNGIFIGPSMAPRFFRASEIPSPYVFLPLPKLGSRLRAQILRHGW